MYFSVPQQPESVTSPRRFVPVHAIPDLRAANAAARSPHPPRFLLLSSLCPPLQKHMVMRMSASLTKSLVTPRTRCFRVRNPFHNVQVAQTTPTRSMSVMSQDSLMANRWAFPFFSFWITVIFRSATWGRNMPKGTPEFSGNITNFGRLPQVGEG